ncbi:MAG: DUF2207 domain-containing protein [Candidatus Magasanikbacteria bacterium]|nr:DUF2207 domain-containing protein [Candidatus Magasanikbacteria bacterium]
MYKKICLVFFVAGLLLIASPVFAEEKIDKFVTDIQLHSDATINIEESIAYDFGDAERHGIFRDITIGYKARGGNYKLRVSDISVVDEKNNPYTFTTSYSGSNLQIKIGDAETLITGKHIYRIRYTVGRAINYFKDHDELYWNATGNGWEVPIGEAETIVRLESDLPDSDVTRTCFFGPYGSTSVCDMSVVEENKVEAGGSVSAVLFKAKNLGSYEGLTVVVGVPVGTIQKPPLTETIWEIIRDNGILLLPVIIFLLLFRRWKKYGKDAKGRGTIIPEYEAPDNLAPAEVGTLYDNRADRTDVSAQIIQLAVNGYLKIRREETGAVFKSTDYVFTKLKPSVDLTKSFDKEIMDNLFEKGEVVKLSDLKYEFASAMQKIIKNLYEDLTKDGYYKNNPMMTKVKYLAGSCLTFFLAFFIGAFFGFLGIFSIIVAALIILVFAFIMPALTQKGAETKEKILGLKLYMTVAEEARIKFHNAPEKNPERFEKLLPYAMVMKVEKEWAKQFEGIYNIQPKWYEDPSHQGMFNAVLLTSSLSSFDTTAASTLGATVSSSASSGGSGFSGGGSGGGFGGGGGGSW